MMKKEWHKKDKTNELETSSLRQVCARVLILQLLITMKNVGGGRLSEYSRCDHEVKDKCLLNLSPRSLNESIWRILQIVSAND